MNNVKLLHIKCCFFQFFNSPVTLKNIKKKSSQEKVEMTPLIKRKISSSVGGAIGRAGLRKEVGLLRPWPRGPKVLRRQIVQ